MYGIFVGEFKKDEANKTAGFSALSSIIIGIFISLMLFIFKGPYLNFYGCTGELLENASAYYNWYILLALVNPMISTVYNLVLAEGGAFYMMLDAIVSIVGKTILLNHSMPTY